MHNWLKTRPFLLAIAIMAFISTACAPAGSGSSTAEGGTAGYYYGDFDDVPIPREMKPEKEATVLHTSSGVKVGTQSFAGGVEIVSLNKAMTGYMTHEGWILISSLRGQRSILVFEKPDRLCVIHSFDGSFSTTMQIFVTPKILNPSAGGINTAPRSAAPVSGIEALKQ